MIVYFYRREDYYICLFAESGFTVGSKHYFEPIEKVLRERFESFTIIQEYSQLSPDFKFNDISDDAAFQMYLYGGIEI